MTKIVYNVTIILRINFTGKNLKEERIMDDPDDPVITAKDVPSYQTVEEKIKEIDNTIIVYRIFYLFDSFIYRFQLIKKNKMCILEIPRNLLENLNKDGTRARQELYRILNLKIEDADCWNVLK